MPKPNLILFLPGFSIKKVVQATPLVIDATYNQKAQCPHCGSKKLRLKHSFFRQVKHESIGIRRAVIRFKAHKFRCYGCKRYFNQRFPGILKYQRATQRLKEQVFQQHTQGVSQSDLAKHLDVGKSTVERWYQQYYHLQSQNRKNQYWPAVLGIDEHLFRKRQFATTFCDLRRHRIFDIAKGRSASEIIRSFGHIPGRERVKIACIDLCVTYRNFIKQYFPKAQIVADRFHVIRLVEHAFMQTCHSINENIKYQRGTLAMLRTHPDNLSEHKAHKLSLFLKANSTIQTLYFFKRRIIRLLKRKHRTAKQCKKLIPVFLRFIHMLKHGRFDHLVKLGKTLYKWREEIVRMWRFTKNNGITEGFHRLSLN